MLGMIFPNIPLYISPLIRLTVTIVTFMSLTADSFCLVSYKCN